MQQSFSILSEPEWLTRVSENTITNDPFPLHEILRSSLYYPSSGFDGDPVKYFVGNVLSFVYVDYGYSHEEFNSALENLGFSGYRVIANRNVTEHELIPQGWTPSLPTKKDGNPLRYSHWIKKPFCSWVVMQRIDGVPDTHGPTRFSLLYLCADGVAAFQSLYVANRVAPRFVAVIQPGHGFGGNYTNFTDEHQFFAKSVLNNPAGTPEFLLYGGIGKRDFYRTPCWPIYDHSIFFLDKAGGGSIGVWQRNAQQGAAPNLLSPLRCGKTVGEVKPWPGELF